MGEKLANKEEEFDAEELQRTKKKNQEVGHGKRPEEDSNRSPAENHGNAKPAEIHGKNHQASDQEGILPWRLRQNSFGEESVVFERMLKEVEANSLYER